MMRPYGEDLKVYLCRAPIDMRNYAESIVMRTRRRRARLSPAFCRRTTAHNDDARVGRMSRASPRAYRAHGNDPA